jgi:hypothetical protein
MIPCTSALACLALIFLAGRSSGVSDMASYKWCTLEGQFETCTIWALTSERGSVGLWIHREHDRADKPETPGSKWAWESSAFSPPADEMVFGFLFLHGRTDRGAEYHSSHELMVPYWLLIALTALPPAVALVRLRRRRSRLASGRCSACGYDLRGGSGNVCPECGAAIAGVAGSAP